MGFKGYSFQDDPSLDQIGGARKPYCTQGYYLGEISNVAPSPEDIAEDKQDYYRWDCRLVEGPSNIGRTMPHYTSLGMEKKSPFATMMHTISLDDVLAKLRAKPPVLVYEDHVNLAKVLAVKAKGRKVGLLIADGQPYRGNPSSDIQEIMTEAEYRERVKLLGDSGGSTSGAVPSSPAPAGGGTLTAANVDALLSGLDDI